MIHVVVVLLQDLGEDILLDGLVVRVTAKGRAKAKGGERGKGAEVRAALSRGKGRG